MSSATCQPFCWGFNVLIIFNTFSPIDDITWHCTLSFMRLYGTPKSNCSEGANELIWMPSVLLSAHSLTHWGRDKMAATLADNTLKHKFVNENILISIKISLKFVSKGPINNIPALVQIMAWRWPGDKPLSEPMMVRLLTHICITRPQWVKLINMNVVQLSKETVCTSFPNILMQEKHKSNAFAMELHLSCTNPSI